MIKGLRFPTTGQNSATPATNPSTTSFNTNTNNPTNTNTNNSNTNELPPGWQEVISRSTGRTYYLQSATGQTTWIRPGSETSQSNTTSGSSQSLNNVTKSFTSGVSRMGAGLTSMFNKANTQLQETLKNNTRSLNATQMARRINNDTEHEGQVMEEIFEYEYLVSNPEFKYKFNLKNPFEQNGWETLIEYEQEILHDSIRGNNEWEIDRDYPGVDKDGKNYSF